MLIGGDSLLLECAAILRARGHDIRAVISSAPRVARWAREQGYRLIADDGKYPATLEALGFDFLFAITHNGVLPESVLALPRRLAVNFHDGPLPRYAGTNAPAWALMRGEKRYGITWQAISRDGAAILKQVEFDISPGETSLSINTRCFEEALSSFGPLCDELATRSEVASPMTGERSFFAKYARPKAAALLDFGRPASELEALVAALDFGKRYPNELGLPKIRLPGGHALVLRAEARAGAGDPGSVLAVEDGAIVVAAGGGSALALLELARPTGAPLPLAEAGVRVGDQLGLHPGLAERLTVLDSELARSEDFWAMRLSHLEPAEIPFAFGAVTASAAPSYERRALELPGGLAARLAPELASAAGDTFALLFAAAIARLSAKSELDLGFADPALAETVAASGGLIAGEIPVHLDFDPALPLARLAARWASELASVRRHRGFMRDLVPRRPELAERAGLVAGHLGPVGIRVIAGKLDDAAPLPGSSLTFVTGERGEGAALIYDPAVLPKPLATRLGRALETFFLAAAEHPERAVGDLPLLDTAERRRVIEEWNHTLRDYPKDVCLHELVEAQTDRTPDAIAVAFENDELTYRQLDERANQLAHHLRGLGIGPDKLVGVAVDRSVELVIAILAVQKAGGAYVPLDPAYPADRLQAMIEDAKMPVLLRMTDEPLTLDPGRAQVVDLDNDAAVIARHPATRLGRTAGPEHLAYVIYTSGSTGRPKGVMIEHRNVVNFFAGMDDRLAHEPPGVWLAVTSLSFDISVLELFYTLARGFKVVVYADKVRTSRGKHGRGPVAVAAGGMDFGIFLWGNDDGPGSKKYQLMLESAKWADTHGFSSIWTPERHFHAFGGPYPNPSVTSAAIAAVTSRIRIQAGSCVAPLHSPIRIAEEWAVVDNLSNGRVAISWASGWQPDDFVLRPENFKDNKQKMIEAIEAVQKLWRGDAVKFAGPRGEVEVKTLPRPVQPTLPSWITSAGNPDTYKLAGKLGYNILTHLLGQSVDEVADKIKIYRQARAEAGHDPDAGIVTLMLHTYVGEDDESVKKLVRKPMKDYLGASVSLIKNYAWAFPAFKKPAGGAPTGPNDVDLAGLSPEENDAVLEFAFERYFSTSGLMGSVETCVEMIESLKKIGVNEIGCLIDFGVETSKVMAALAGLDEVRRRTNTGVTAAPAAPARELHTDFSVNFSFGAQVERHGVTHFQCTPSMARMLLMQDDTRAALARVRHMMVGGEALPPTLANELAQVVGSAYSDDNRSVTNMYGPTETTIWSSTQKVEAGMASVPIGTPIANTQLYVLDARLHPTPVGVPGELYIGGDGVVRGYLERAELTAERFVTDPFLPGNRMYKTGDLARWRDDGVVEYLGRTDFQVKIRGYRIELGEIEAALSRMDGIREAVVAARQDTAGEQLLCAYLVPVGAAPDVKAVREHLRANLPDPMVPGAFVILDALPLTPNGKVDRKALPAPDPVKAESHAAFVAPEGGIQEKLAELWKETLGLAQVGVNDNFFELGGHSLLVVRLHRRIRETMPDVPVAITDLYRLPTIRGLAESLGAAGGKDERLSGAAERAARRRQGRGRS